MFLWLNFLLSCVLSLGFKPIVYDDFRNNNFSTESRESLNCSETKSRDNYFSTGDYLFLFANDFESVQFGNVLFSNIDSLGTQFNNFSSDIMYPTELNDVIYASIGDPINGSVFGYLRQVNSDYSVIGVNGYPVSAIYFDRVYVLELNNGQRLYHYDITLAGRDGAGNYVNYIRYTYQFYFPYYYQPSLFDSLISLGNGCYSVYTNFITGSPITESNYSNYVYQEYIGEGYPSPFYNSYYLGLNNSVTIQQARQEGYNVGFDEGRTSGLDEGRQIGFAEGVDYAYHQDTTALTIFTGIIDVGLLPVNVFLKIFEFEVFGINIAGALSALLTIAVTFIVLRFITGKKND